MEIRVYESICIWLNRRYMLPDYLGNCLLEYPLIKNEALYSPDRSRVYEYRVGNKVYFRLISEVER